MILNTLRNRSGFSFFEIIIVMVLIAVFAVIAIVRHTYNDPTLLTQAQVLKAHMRFAQMRSMNTESSWGINYQVSGSEKSYWLFKQPNDAVKIALPGEAKDQVRLDEVGIEISQGSFILYFDGWGAPESTIADKGTLTLNLTRAGESEQIIVTQNTGFIP